MKKESLEEATIRVLREGIENNPDLTDGMAYNDYKRLKADPSISEKEKWNDIYKQQIIDYGEDEDNFPDRDIKDMNENVREWYKRAYPNDEMGDDIIDNLTLKDFVKEMANGESPYDILDVGDSIVRERVFEALSDFLNVDYDVFYYSWLYGEDKPNHPSIEQLKKLAASL